jgi:hypothetical protein
MLVALLTRWAPVIQAAGTLFLAVTLTVYWLQLTTMQAQLQHAARANQTLQYHAALNLMCDWRAQIIADPHLADGFRAEPFFAEVFEILPDREYFHTLSLFNIFEHYWLLHDRATIDDDMWRGWSRNIVLIMSQGKKQRVWEHLRRVEVFNPRFVAYVDAALLAAKAAAAEPSTRPPGSAAG